MSVFIKVSFQNISVKCIYFYLSKEIQLPQFLLCYQLSEIVTKKEKDCHLSGIGNSSGLTGQLIVGALCFTDNLIYINYWVSCNVESGTEVEFSTE